MDQVFYNEQGKLYKAAEAKSPVDMHMHSPTQDILDALDANPITREEMIARINHPEFPRKQAVIAEEKEKENAKIAE